MTDLERLGGQAVRIFLLMAGTTFLGVGCSDDQDGIDLSFDPDISERVDASEPTDMGADAGGELADAGLDADAVDSGAREDRGPALIQGCQPDEDLHPAETPWRQVPPVGRAIELAWSANPPPQGGDPLTEITPISVPSLSSDQIRVGADPLLYAVSDGTTAEGEIRQWSVSLDLRTGESYGGGSSGTSADTARSNLPSPTLRRAQARGTATIEYNPITSSYGFDLSWRQESSAASTSSASPVQASGFSIGRFLLMPRGLAMLHWGERWLFGLDAEVFTRSRDFRSTAYWVTSTERMWGEGGEGAALEWLAGPRPGEVVALLTSTEGDRKWVAIDRCGEATDIYADGRLQREILWDGSSYLVQLDESDVAEGPKIARVENGAITDESDFGCRNLVERDTDAWACLREGADGFEIVNFDVNLQATSTESLPAVEGFEWRSARLELAASNHELVVRGTGVSDEGAAHHFVGVIDDDASQAIAIEPIGDDSAAAADSIYVGILGPNGKYVFVSGTAIYAVQTYLGGLAATRHPRALYGGNESRGYVEP